MIDIRDGFENMDLEKVSEMLQKTYWADDRSKETIEKSMRNSFCVGAFENGCQIGFLRAVTDYSTVYYICDVIIDENYRGKNIGKMILEHICNIQDFKNLRGILATKDAHKFYEKFGFEKNEKLFMQKWNKIFL